MSDDEFRDHVVVITGASAGIGLEVARQLARQGAGADRHVLVRDRLRRLVERRHTGRAAGNNQRALRGAAWTGGSGGAGGGVGGSGEKGDWAHTFSQIYRDGYNDELPISVRNGSYIPENWNPRVSNYTTYNYSLAYSGFDNMKLTFGVKNLTDEDPPFTAHMNDYAAGAGWETRIAEPRGRAYNLLVEYKFR